MLVPSFVMVLELRAMEKRFGGWAALRRGELSVRAGEVHLLLGENGAGKSTLMKIVAGLHTADGGEMLWRGQPVRFQSPVEAQRAGIAMVHQESLLAPHLTVAENIWLGREPAGRFGWIRKSELFRRAQRLLEEHRFPLQADSRVGALSPAGQQLVEICRAIAHNASLLIFDEPTSALSEGESREVFRIVKSLRDRGVAVIYITHRMEELRGFGDRVTVLRDGETVFTSSMSETDTPALIRHMVGRELASVYQRKCAGANPGPVKLRVEGLSRKGAFDGVSFDLRAGEIVGLAGLMGAGRTELCRALFGVEPATSGKIFVNGVEQRIGSPRNAVRAGMALIPEDRQRAGLALNLSCGVNMTLASVDGVSRFGFLNFAKERTLVSEHSARLQLKSASASMQAGRLSGGNQQKIVIAKWVLRGAEIYLFDEPTRGIDIGAKAEVFHLMDELARQGAAVLMVSSELPELIGVADRILVMRQGRLTAELPARSSQEEILRHAALEQSAAAGA